MFGFLKSNPKKKLQKEYESLMQKAVLAQRNGKIALYADLSFEADLILKKIKELESQSHINNS